MSHLSALRPALAAAGLAYLLGAVVGLVPFTLQLGVPPGLDTVAYWRLDYGGLYDNATIGERGAYLYSPAFAQVVWPLGLLPFEAAYALWLAGSLAVLAWMRVLWLVAFPPVLADLYFGNVHVFYAAAIILGFRFAPAWALLVLTKVTPGLGLLWFVVRREWRSLAAAVTGTAAVVVLSFAFSPSSWVEWGNSLMGNVGQATGMRSDAVPLGVRVAVSAALISWGAVTDRRWTLPWGVMLASPTIWPGTGAVLIAAFSPRLYSWRSHPTVDPSPDGAERPFAGTSVSSSAVRPG